VQYIAAVPLHNEDPLTTTTVLDAQLTALQSALEHGG
jgi:hypothetical protein